MTHYTDATVQLHHGDCLDVLRELPDASVDAVVTDPPYAINFMGRSWDSFGKGGFVGACEECGNDDPTEGYRLCSDCLEQADEADLRAATMLGQQSQNWHAKATHSRGYADNNNAAFQRWCLLWTAECLRVLKPGGHLLAFGGTRTWHRLACAVEDAGFEVRDSIAWLYGSGFPKSLDVSKAIDKAAGAEREVIGSGITGAAYTRAARRNANEGFEGGQVVRDLTAPATDDARTWQGWGTALKPAHEPVVVARKPLAGTVAANVLAWGTGALNVDGCRVGREEGDRTEYGRGNHLPHANTTASLGRFSEVTPYNPHAAGRWPANVVLDEGQAEALDQQSGESASREHPSVVAGGRLGNAVTHGAFVSDSPRMGGHTDTGGASRFFYVAKADASERVRVAGVAHPTVKPLALMRWLVRLVTPPGGTVLEPFAGSGTTVEACILEGFRCIAIEREAEYLPLIEQRIHRRRDPVAAVRGSGEDGGLFDLLDEEPTA